MLNKIIKRVFDFICYRGGRLFFKLWLCPMYRIRAFGKENVPKDGPMLLLCNHQSYFDPILCQIPLTRSVYGVARDSLYYNKVLAFFLHHVNTIPIRRGRADIASMRRIMSKLKDGWGVFLFPEATRTYDGKIIDVKPGFSLLSRKTGAKVIPVVIDGAYECWPRDKKLPSLTGRIAVIYGDPIEPEDIKGLSDKEFARIITGRLRALQSKCRKKMNREPFDYSNS